MWVSWHRKCVNILWNYVQNKADLLTCNDVDVITLHPELGNLEIKTWRSMENMENQEHQSMLIAPPDNYAFNNLIQDFVDEINGDDVENLKQRFEGIVPKNVQTSRQIVNYLRENGYISETNIIYLQQIVRILRRPNLLLKTIDFAKCNEETPVLHIRETATKIRPGFQAIRIHVEGHGRLTHEELDELRHRISKIVLVPPEDVSFAGIEETGSLLITIVLPDMYCEALHMLLLNPRKHFHFLSLRKFGVDRIEVLETWYDICEKAKHINGCEASETDRNEDKLLLTPESSNTEDEMNVEEKSDVVVDAKKRNKTLVTKSDKERKQRFQPYTI